MTLMIRHALHELASMSDQLWLDAHDEQLQSEVQNGALPGWAAILCRRRGYILACAQAYIMVHPFLKRNKIRMTHNDIYINCMHLKLFLSSFKSITHEKVM